MQINIETKFNIGQEVYIIQKARSKEPCAACNGEGHIIIDGNRFSYDTCRTDGKVSKIKYETRKKVIDDVRVLNTLKTNIVRYGFKNGAVYTERNVFATQEEAETRCNELNKEVRDNGNR